MKMPFVFENIFRIGDVGIRNYLVFNLGGFSSNRPTWMLKLYTPYVGRVEQSGFVCDLPCCETRRCRMELPFKFENIFRIGNVGFRNYLAFNFGGFSSTRPTWMLKLYAPHVGRVEQRGFVCDLPGCETRRCRMGLPFEFENIFRIGDVGFRNYLAYNFGGFSSTRPTWMLKLYAPYVGRVEQRSFVCDLPYCSTRRCRMGLPFEFENIFRIGDVGFRNYSVFNFGGFSSTRPTWM